MSSFGILNVVLVIAGIAALVIGGICLFTEDGSKPVGCVVSIVGVVIIIIGLSVVWVPAGYAGVKIVAGSPSNEAVMPGHLNWHAPFFSSIHYTSCKRKEENFGETVFSCETSTPTVVNLSDVSVTYSVIGEKIGYIWQTTESMDTDLLKDRIRQVSTSLKDATKSLDDYNVTTRSILQPLARDLLEEALISYYGDYIVQIHNVSIGNISFNPDYEALLEETARVKKELEKADAQIELDKKKAEAEKEKAIINAQKDAESMMIRAEATAKANDIVAKSLTPELLNDKWIEKWDSHMPTVVGGDGTMMYGIGNIPNIASE